MEPLSKQAPVKSLLNVIVPSMMARSLTRISTCEEFSQCSLTIEKLKREK